MQILGHPLIAYQKLYSIQKIDEIESASDEHILLFEYDSDLLRYVKENQLPFALHIFNESEAVLANALGAKILICNEKISQKIQQLAEYYMFDTKVAILINDEEEIQKAIDLRVDMAILPSAIV